MLIVSHQKKLNGKKKNISWRVCVLIQQSPCIILFIVYLIFYVFQQKYQLLGFFLYYLNIIFYVRMNLVGTHSASIICG